MKRKGSRLRSRHALPYSRSRVEECEQLEEGLLAVEGLLITLQPRLSASISRSPQAKTTKQNWISYSEIGIRRSQRRGGSPG